MSPFFDHAFAAGAPAVRLVDEDPELFEGLSPRALLEARSRAVARAVRLSRGSWDGRLPNVGRRSGDLGLLVIEGLLIRNVRVGREPRSELVGVGDLTRPWDHEGDNATMPFGADWLVLEPARIAVLDMRFLAAACRWPTVIAALISRTVRRSHSLSLQLAVSDVRHIRERLLLLFWHLADRWGHVGRDGVVVPLRLTHEVIARLVGARRPTVTTALHGLAQEGTLKRQTAGGWLLDPASAQSATEKAPEPRRPRPAAASGPAHVAP